MKEQKEEEYKKKTYLKAVIRGTKELNCVLNADNVFHYESYVEIPSKRNAAKENDNHLKGTYIKFVKTKSPSPKYKKFLIWPIKYIKHYKST